MYGTGGPKTASATLPITIQNANDPPAFTKGPDVLAVVGQAFTMADWATAITPGPTRPTAWRSP